MATKIFGQEIKSTLFLPKASASWEMKDLIKKGDFDNVLLLSFSIADQEIVDVRRCFEETTHIFAFGRNTQTSVMQISFLVYLYDGCPSKKYKWLTITKIREKYNKQRIYKLQQSMQITIDDLSLNGFLTRMDIGEVDPSKKTAVISFTFILDQEV